MNIVGYIREYGGESSGIYFGFMRAITSYRNVCFFNWFFRGVYGLSGWVWNGKFDGEIYGKIKFVYLVWYGLE